MPRSQIINKTLDYADLEDPRVQPTARALRRWVWRWFFSLTPLGVNGHVKLRTYIRPHKLWEYARGLALTGASGPTREPGTRLTVLDVGGAMTAPVFYLASLGDQVVCLDIHEAMTARTNEIARAKRLAIDARTTNLTEEDPDPADLGAPEHGFDRVYCFCVIEHILPPGQERVAGRMAKLLRPGGQMCLTFDYGRDAPTEAPMHTREHVEAIRDAVGLPLMGNDQLLETGTWYCLDARHPQRLYTFGSLFFRKPEPG